MTFAATLPRIDRRRLGDIADGFAIALAFALPVSTSAVSILTVLWLLALLPTLDGAALRRELTTASGGLPVLLVALAAAGTLWSHVDWAARIEGLVSFLKLLVIPLLFAQFRHSPRGRYFVDALLVACIALLAVSCAGYWFGPSGWYPFAQKQWGVPVKDYISQSGFFTLCGFVLIDRAAIYWRHRRRVVAVLCMALALAFAADMAMIALGRTTLMVAPVLLVLFMLRRLHWKGALALCLACGALAALAWSTSPYLRERTESIAVQYRDYRAGIDTSVGERLDFYRTGLGIIERAPLIGHGTGSIRAMFERYGASGSEAQKTTNPHNQTLALAIQLGLVGTIVLYALWIAHLLLFWRSGSAVAWFGLVVVAQNIVSSLVNTHLFDFTQGWTYAICVGVAGGAVLREAAGRAPGSGAAPPGPV